LDFLMGSILRKVTFNGLIKSADTPSMWFLSPAGPSALILLMAIACTINTPSLAKAAGVTHSMVINGNLYLSVAAFIWIVYAFNSHSIQR